jgi:glycosyltransferase involved in cell wall biosynthesis
MAQAAEDRQSIPPQTGVSIVVPAYHEEHAIGAVLDQINEVMQQSSLTYEIIVVDDGSDDATATVAEQSTYATVLCHRTNRGYGAALKTGIRHARYPLVCITDADGTYPNEQIPTLVNTLTTYNYDMVVGSRTGDTVSIPLVRRPAKWVISQLANFVAGDTIPDINSGLRAFRTDIALRLLTLLPDGFSFTTTITLAMLTGNYLVDYIPIDYHKRVGKSKIKPIRDTANFVRLILRMGLYFVPLKVFLPMSVALIILAIVWGVATRMLFGQLADVTTIVIAMTGIQVAIFGLLAELINHRMPSMYRKDQEE